MVGKIFGVSFQIKWFGQFFCDELRDILGDVTMW